MIAAGPADAIEAEDSADRAAAASVIAAGVPATGAAAGGNTVVGCMANLCSFAWSTEKAGEGGKRNRVDESDLSSATKAARTMDQDFLGDD